MISRCVRGLLAFLMLAELSRLLAAEEGVNLPAESRASAARYAEARKQIAAGNDSAAVEALQGLIETGESTLIAVDGRHSLQTRWAAHLELSRLGRKKPAALRLYRRRVEEQAQRRLKQALAERDDDGLRTVVEELFCSEAALVALDRLGDRAFERGSFAEAVAWWRMLAPLPVIPADGLERWTVLVHPGPISEAMQARVRAKQLLARLFAGGDDSWQADLAGFRGLHGQAQGTLAGRKGLYGQILTEMAGRRRPPRAAEDWPTFAGSPSRQHVAAGGEEVVEQISGLCRDGVSWKLDLEERSRMHRALLPPDGNVPDSTQARTLAFHPILLGNQLIVADARYVTAFDLRSGKSSEWYDVAQVNGGVRAELHLPAPADLRYTLSAGVDCVYARLGVQALRPEEIKGAAEDRPERRGDNESFLVCLSRDADRAGNRVRWCIRGRLHGAVFEGAPVVGHGQLYVAATHIRGERSVTSIDCYAAGTAGEPPLRWRREVCVNRLSRTDTPRYRHHLLTLAGGQVVYCSDSGVIAAVDSHTGQLSWALRYPPAEETQEEPSPLRDLTPPVFADGRVYAAPTDSDRLLCLDPATGRLLWERQGLHVVHLLGVGQGRLIFTTNDGLRAVGAADGSDGSGWSLPDAGGGVIPMGRGLLVGDVVLWPTTQVRTPGFPPRRVVYAVRQRDGRPADDPALLHNLPAGNLLHANGCLVSCGTRTAAVFVPPSWKLPERQRQALLSPDSAQAALALARAQADAGQLPQSLRSLDRARRLAPAAREASLQEGDHILRMALATAIDHGSLEEAGQRQHQLDEAPGKPAERARNRLQAAALWERRGHPEQAIRSWKGLLAADDLRDVLVEMDGSLARAADHAAAGLERLGQPVPPPAQSEAAGEQTPAPAPPELPWRRSWHVSLPDGDSVLPGSPASERWLFTAGKGANDSGRIACWSMQTGRRSWQRTLPFCPCWSACHGSLMLAAGAEGVACLQQADGRLLWQMLAEQPLADFQLAGERLFFRWKEERLLAAAISSGRVLWQEVAPGAGLQLAYPFGRLFAHYHAGRDTVLVQTRGRRRLLAADTGQCLHETSASAEPWPRAILALDERRLCIVSDLRHITLLDARSGQTHWRYMLPVGSMLDGCPPQVVKGRDCLLVLVSTNVGQLLYRLDPDTGTQRGDLPLDLGDEPLDTSCWAVDGEVVYLASGGQLQAWSLTDQRLLWSQPLPEGGRWQVRREGDCLVCIPLPAAAERLQFRLGPATLQWEKGPLGSGELFRPVECRDPNTGQLVQRLYLQARYPARLDASCRVRVTREGLSLNVRTLPANGGEPCLRWSSAGGLAALGSEVWGLSAEK